MNLKDIASISGKPGLYKILKPTHSGVLIETIGDKKVKNVISANYRISILKEISIFTNTEEGSEPLEDVFLNIEELYGNELPLSSSNSSADLEAFIAKVVPDYDDTKVYTSDIKKLVSWYGLLKKYVPEIFDNIKEERAAAEKEAEEAATVEEGKE